MVSRKDAKELSIAKDSLGALITLRLCEKYRFHAKTPGSKEAKDFSGIYLSALITSRLCEK